MRINFIYTDHADLSTIPQYDRFINWIDVPDEVQQLPNPAESVMELAKKVGRLTRACLHITCKPLGIIEEFIKANDYGSEKPEDVMTIVTPGSAGRIMLQSNRRAGAKPFTIYHPISLQLSTHYRSNYHLNPELWKTEKERGFVQLYRDVADILLLLLNADPQQHWLAYYFHPWLWDNAIIKKGNKQKKAREKARKKQEREAKKKKKTIQSTDKPHPETGAGRRSGAIPGIFMDVQMRSQLEIRLAAELQDRGIMWIYERERLGDGNYLVDFHLPDHKCWIEVKGKVEARDKFLLRDVATVLNGERGERLFMYTSRRAYEISSGGIGDSMKQNEFWELLSGLR